MINPCNFILKSDKNFDLLSIFYIHFTSCIEISSLIILCGVKLFKNMYLLISGFLWLLGKFQGKKQRPCLQGATTIAHLKWKNVSCFVSLLKWICTRMICLGSNKQKRKFIQPYRVGMFLPKGTFNFKHVVLSIQFLNLQELFTKFTRRNLWKLISYQEIFNI